jgi:Ca2+-binding EF-hand superfamily protein
MGQQIGRAALVPAAGPFSNLSRRAIANLWQAFNDIADGFGVSKDEFEEICCDLKDEWNVSRLSVTGKAAVFFKLLDTDKNGLIDALEFVSTVAALSGMRLNEVLEFVLSIYDFDGSQLLSIDEVTLAFKSLTNGLCKLTDLIPPKEEAIEHLVTRLFSDCSGSEDTDFIRLRVSMLAENLTSHPDIRSWFSFFGSPTFVAGKASYQ